MASLLSALFFGLVGWWLVGRMGKLLGRLWRSGLFDPDEELRSKLVESLYTVLSFWRDHHGDRDCSQLAARDPVMKGFRRFAIGQKTELGGLQGAKRRGRGDTNLWAAFEIIAKDDHVKTLRAIKSSTIARSHFVLMAHGRLLSRRKRPSPEDVSAEVKRLMVRQFGERFVARCDEVENLIRATIAAATEASLLHAGETRPRQIQMCVVEEFLDEMTSHEIANTHGIEPAVDGLHNGFLRTQMLRALSRQIDAMRKDHEAASLDLTGEDVGVLAADYGVDTEDVLQTLIESNGGAAARIGRKIVAECQAIADLAALEPGSWQWRQREPGSGAWEWLPITSEIVAFLCTQLAGQGVSPEDGWRLAKAYGLADRLGWIKEIVLERQQIGVGEQAPVDRWHRRLNFWKVFSERYRERVVRDLEEVEDLANTIKFTIGRPASPTTVTMKQLGDDLVAVHEHRHGVDGASVGDLHLFRPSRDTARAIGVVRAHGDFPPVAIAARPAPLS